MLLQNEENVKEFLEKHDKCSEILNTDIDGTPIKIDNSTTNWLCVCGKSVICRYS